MKFSNELMRLDALLELQDNLELMQKQEDNHPSEKYVRDLKDKLIKGGASELEAATVCLHTICSIYDELIEKNFKAISADVNIDKA